MTARRNVMLLVAVFLVLGFACQAAAEYYLASFYVQHRKYEDGKDFNRFYLRFNDDVGNPVENDVLLSAKLYDPTKAEVEILELAYTFDNYIINNYDGNANRWFYKQTFLPEGGYNGKVAGSLVNGIYSLVAVDKNNKIHTGQFTIFGIVKLPAISSTSFKPRLDQYGNFICEWAVPWSLCAQNPAWNTNVLTMIDIYDGENYKGAIYTTIPTHMGRLFVPANIVDLAKAMGSSFKFSLQLRTNDNNNRWYSTKIPITL
jgi:hypothetical protein